MSEITIIGKPVVPSVRVSTLDAHHITTPVPRPTRPTRGSEEAPTSGAGELEASPRKHQGGQPLQPATGDVRIGKTPTIEHTTSNSSSRSATISAPPQQRAGRQPQRPGLIGSSGAQVAKIPADEAELLAQLAQSYHDGLPAGAKVSRALAARAFATVRALSR